MKRTLIELAFSFTFEGLHSSYWLASSLSTCGKKWETFLQKGEEEKGMTSKTGRETSLRRQIKVEKNEAIAVFIHNT